MRTSDLCPNLEKGHGRQGATADEDDRRDGDDARRREEELSHRGHRVPDGQRERHGAAEAGKPEHVLKLNAERAQEWPNGWPKVA